MVVGALGSGGGVGRGITFGIELHVIKIVVAAAEFHFQNMLSRSECVCLAGYFGVGVPVSRFEPDRWQSFCRPDTVPD